MAKKKSPARGKQAKPRTGQPAKKSGPPRGKDRVAGSKGPRAASGRPSQPGKPAKSVKPRPGRPTRKATSKPDEAVADPRQRLQRVMASAGIASRRECELIIQEGRVEVDGQVVTELGYKVDPTRQEIVVDAEKIKFEPVQYFVLNKPAGIVSTSNDPSGRPRVIDLIDTRQRVYTVGRLDQSSEGLMLVTNDGQLAHRLTHPRYGIEKIYHVQVDGRPTPAALQQLQSGIYIAEAKVRAENIRYLKRAKNGSWLEIILKEGRNREIRRMLAAIGHKVRTLKRVAIGPLRLKDLPVGAHRPLTPGELAVLQRATSGTAKPKRRPTRKPAATEGTETPRPGGSRSTAEGKRTSKWDKPMIYPRGPGRPGGGKQRKSSPSSPRPPKKGRRK